jgi:hypothetical protein
MKSENARNRRQVRGPTGGPDTVAQEIAQLPTLDAPALRQPWAQLLGDDAPPSPGRNMMLQAIAYRLQERAFGGLKPSTSRYLTGSSMDPDRMDRSARPH